MIEVSILIYDGAIFQFNWRSFMCHFSCCGLLGTQLTDSQ